METELVGVRAAARELGVHASTISRNVKAGIIPNHGTEDEPLIDVEEAREARNRELDPSKRGNAAGELLGDDDDPADQETTAGESHSPAANQAPANDGYRDARTDRERIHARLAQVQLEKQLGELGRKADFEAAGFDAGRMLRDGLLNMVDTIAPDLAALDRADAIADLLRAEVLKALEQMAARLRARADVS